MKSSKICKISHYFVCKCTTNCIPQNKLELDIADYYQQKKDKLNFFFKNVKLVTILTKCKVLVFFIIIFPIKMG